MNNQIRLDTANCRGFVTAKELKDVFNPMKLIHKAIEKKECPGSDFLGWLDLPSRLPAKLLRDIETTAKKVRSQSDVFLSLGIGGSYLGAKATVEFLQPNFCNEQEKKSLKLYFAGHNLSSDYLSDLFKIIQNKRVSINVISKSGTTTETAVVFRLVRKFLEKKYSKKQLKDRIICTTDARKGALRGLAEEEGFKTFVIPDDVGGRFSVLTPVGLLPIAVSGANIRQLIAGAADFEKKSRVLNLSRNMSYRYAAIRHVLYKKGKEIEILSGFHPSLHFVGEWWKQLFGESEGKNNKGIFPAVCDFTTDLHSMGQMIQDGRRNIFETFLVVDKSNSGIKIPRQKDNTDGLNYLAGKDLDYVNKKAYEATATAHFQGKVPNMTVSIPERKEYYLGQLFYFFERATAMSGLLSGVNPFNQPGVEAYKKEMFRLLGKPGY